jgi:hypothetical protein
MSVSPLIFLDLHISSQDFHSASTLDLYLPQTSFYSSCISLYLPVTPFIFLYLHVRPQELLRYPMNLLVSVIGPLYLSLDVSCQIFLYLPGSPYTSSGSLVYPSNLSVPPLDLLVSSCNSLHLPGSPCTSTRSSLMPHESACISHRAPVSSLKLTYQISLYLHLSPRAF